MALRRNRRQEPEAERPSGVQLRAALDAIGGPEGPFPDAAFLEACTETFLLAQRAWTERDPELTREVLLPGIWEEHRRQIEDYRAMGRRNVLNDLAVDDVQIVATAVEGDLDSVTVRFFARCADYDIDVTRPEQTIVRGTTAVQVWAEDWVFQRPVGDDGPWRLGRIEQLSTYEHAQATLPDPER